MFQVYENVVFGGKQHVRLTDMPGMAERTLTVCSASKLFSLTGWRVGWVTGPEELIRGVSVVHQHTTVCAPTPLQAGVAAALDEEEGDFIIESGESVPRLYEANYGRLASAFLDAGLEPCAAGGGYFLVVDGRRTGLDDRAFAKRLIELAQVAGMPMGAFYVEEERGGGRSADELAESRSLVRFSVCKAEDSLSDAAERIRKLTLGQIAGT